MNPLETRPRAVALVALGPSKHDFLNSLASKKEMTHFDEVWTINSLAGHIKAHKCFVMDDLKELDTRYPNWTNQLRTLSEPIITCHAYPEWPSSVAYPINEVKAAFHEDWFTSTVAYAIAYATFIQVTDLYLFGCDFFYPGSVAVEPGADCCAYWLGRARERGTKYKIPQSSTMLDSHITQINAEQTALKRPLYGYDYNPGRLVEKVNRGQASEFEKKLAAKAPNYGAV